MKKIRLLLSLSLIFGYAQAMEDIFLAPEELQSSELYFDQVLTTINPFDGEILFDFNDELLPTITPSDCDTPFDYETFMEPSLDKASLAIQSDKKAFPCNKKSFQCTVCNKMFTQYYLPTHMRIHTGEKPFECALCLKTFTNSSNLSQHTSNHHSIQLSEKPTHEKSFQCAVCNKMFTKNYLPKHIKIHTGEKPFKCTQCGKAFGFKQGFKRHLRNSHSTEAKDQFECSDCDKTFTAKQSLKRHVKELHSTVSGAQKE